VPRIAAVLIAAFACLSSGAVTNPNYRTPVVSSGLSARFNVLGYAILEAYVAHPFQRPGKNWLWGFQLVPGW